MKLVKLLQYFSADEDGAVTVGQVFLTAAIDGPENAVLASVFGGTTKLSDKIGSNLAAQTIATY